MSIEEFKRPERLDEDRIEALKNLFPEAFPDGQLSFQTLKEILEDPFVPALSDHEFYGISWPGKKAARKLAVQPNSGTLIAKFGEGINEETTSNILIEGDNLEVLKILQRAYTSRVKLIYIDPPYNTGDDFIYNDNFSESVDAYLDATNQRDFTGLLVSNKKTDGRFHSKWLSMMLPRIKLAKNLLTEDGVIVVSINDHERDNLKLLMDEIFGLENFIGSFVWKSRKTEDSRAVTGFSNDHEYMLVYRQNDLAALRGSEKDMSKFSNPDNDVRGEWRSADLTGLATKDARPNLHYPITDPKTNITYEPPEKGWRFEKKTMEEKIKEGRILFPKLPTGRPRHKIFSKEMKSDFKNMSSVITDLSTGDGTKETNRLIGTGIFDFPKPSELIMRIIEQITGPGDIILDFFGGSGTTGHAVFRLNSKGDGDRKFILVQIDAPTDIDSTAKREGYETLSQITKQKLRTVSKEILNNISEQRSSCDIGFRVYGVSRSNLTKFIPRIVENVSQLNLLDFSKTGSLVPDYNTTGVINEIMLLEGFPLDSNVTEATEFQDVIYIVMHPDRSYRLLVCLSTDFLSEETIKEAARYSKDTFVCLEASLTDELKLRLADAVENVKTL